MQQRGRRSAAALSLAVDGAPQRLEPPEGLSKAVAKQFREMVAEVKPSHFVASDLPLMAAYAQATVLNREYALAVEAGDWKALVPFERTCKLMAILATKLRLCPQSRIDARVAESRTRRQSSSAALLRGVPRGEDED
jgi:hypothetical protein